MLTERLRWRQEPRSSIGRYLAFDNHRRPRVFGRSLVRDSVRYIAGPQSHLQVIKAQPGQRLRPVVVVLGPKKAEIMPAK